MFRAAISKCSILINKSIYMYVNLSEPSMIFRTRSVSLSLPWSGTQSRLGSSSSGTSRSFLLPRFRTLNRKILKSFQIIFSSYLLPCLGSGHSYWRNHETASHEPRKASGFSFKFEKSVKKTKHHLLMNKNLDPPSPCKFHALEHKGQQQT